MASIVVVGGSLPGMAAAARLAKAGHRVTLVEQSDHLGGRLAEPGVWAPVLGFPAPLRDLFRKSGRAFDAEFGRRGLTLVAAPPAVHTFADGSTLAWPTDRAEQWHLLHDRYSPALAAHWRDTLDDLDEVWQQLRHLGLEAELTDRSQITTRRHHLVGRRTVEDLATHLRHPHLAELVRDTAWRIGSDPRHTPAWLATRLSVERTFGRWQLVDAAGTVQPATVILDALADRLATRGVLVELGTRVTAIRPDGVTTVNGVLPAQAVLSTLDPWQHARLTDADLRHRLQLGRLRPALAPAVTVQFTPDHTSVGEEIHHTPLGPIVTFRRPVAGGIELVQHDHTDGRPTPGAGVRWQGSKTWLQLPAVRTRRAGLYVASASGRGGNEPWAQLLTGALAVYAAHAALTGQDIRPTNRDYKP